MELLYRQRFKEIGQVEWENTCHHTEEIEQHYYEKDGIVKRTIERILIQDNDTESSDSNDDQQAERSDSIEVEGMSGVEELGNINFY